MKHDRLKNFKKWSFFVALIFCSLQIFAQERTITGTILDASTGEPMPGVNIMIEGTTVGTISDIDGGYSIKVPDASAVLVFSFISYEPQSIVVEDKTVIDVSLEVSAEELDELIVVGYGTMKKSDVTGSIVSINDKDFKQVKTTNVIESLQGKAAGVDITRTSGEAGSGFDIRVRGERSLSGNNDPLYIVDGIQYGSGININPNDIESIEILKDVASTSIYGAKGANGVVIITTKKGSEGTPKINFSMYAGINKPLGSLPYMDRNSYMKYKEDMVKFSEWDRSRQTEWPDSVEVSWTGFELEGIENGTDTKWLDLITRTGYMKNYFLSVSGGTSGMTYNISADYTNEQGMLKNDDYKRYVIKGGVDVKVNKHLTVGTSNILSYVNRNQADFSEKAVQLMNPLAVPYDSAGNLILTPTTPGTQLTPLWYFQDGYYIKEELTSRIFSNVYANIKILEGLNLRSTFNADISTYRMGEYRRADVEDVQVEMFIRPSKDITWSNILTFDKTFGIHHIQVTGVNELMMGNKERYRITGIDPSIPNSLWYALDGMDEISVGIDPDEDDEDEYSYSEGSTLSFLGRINYTLLGKYVATASLRYDGSSVLANTWDYFPSASIAWNMGEEDFLKQLSVLSQMKLRLSYGVSGNYAVPTYSSVDRVNLSPLYYEFGAAESVAYGYRPVYAGNNNLGWEKTASYNIGMDFGLIRNRISGNIDVYKANTTKLLQFRKLPAHAAIPFIYDNVGEVETKGVEVMFHSINISPKASGNFKWTTDISFTRNREKILELAAGVKRDEANEWFVGEPIKVFYDLEKIGIWQLTDSAEMAMFNAHGATLKYGYIKIKDQNGDTIIDDADRIVLGTPRPDWYGSLTNYFEYKGFDLSIIIMARIGQMVNDGVTTKWPTRTVYSESGMEVDYWTPENPTNESPRPDQVFSAVNYMPNYSSLQYTDGSWIKVRDITLGYTIPANLTNQVKINSLRLYVSAKNAFVLYSPLFDKGRYDPEMVGKTTFPMPKTYLFGLTLDF